ncbi:hypothetical protein, partial [Labrys sp. 22185]|uniref:hypothetical protein n=1 Tax=Labrys sp. 22185 TaxID=3453888 RepID=UPI003F8434C8
MEPSSQVNPLLRPFLVMYGGRITELGYKGNWSGITASVTVLGGQLNYNILGDTPGWSGAYVVGNNPYFTGAVNFTGNSHNMTGTIQHGIPLTGIASIYVANTFDEQGRRTDTALGGSIGVPEAPSLFSASAQVGIVPVDPPGVGAWIQSVPGSDIPTYFGYMNLPSSSGVVRGWLAAGNGNGKNPYTVPYDPSQMANAIFYPAAHSDIRQQKDYNSGSANYWSTFIDSAIHTIVDGIDGIGPFIANQFDGIATQYSNWVYGGEFAPLPTNWGYAEDSALLKRAADEYTSGEWALVENPRAANPLDPYWLTLNGRPVATTGYNGSGSGPIPPGQYGDVTERLAKRNILNMVIPSTKEELAATGFALPIDSPEALSGSNSQYPANIHFAFNPADPLGWAADNGDFSAIARMGVPPFRVPPSFTGAPNTVNPDAYSLNNLPASRLRSIIDAGGQSQLQNPYRSWSDFDAAQATSAFLAGGKLPGSLNFNALNRLGNRILADLNRLAPQATPTIGGSSGRIPVPPGYTQQLSSFHAAATAPISPSQALPSNFSTPSGWQLLSNNGYGGIGLGNGAVIGYNPNFANGRVPGISFTIPLPPFPVILDLDGDGLRIDPLSSSTQFVDQNGDGYHSRIAWAGKGDGVLVLDADHDGKLSNAKEFAFTEWDSTAKGDLEALKNIFDTNHNGKLDAGDAKWADFKVLVDGQMKSLSELGIASIDLTPSGSGQSFSDGSAITGTTTFTRTNGTTGAAGDAVLATESGSYIVKQTKTTNADGSVTTD